MIYKACFNSPVGELYITADDETLLSVSFFGEITKADISNQIIKKTVKQLNEYFLFGRKFFDLPLNPKGSDFQKKVWSELIKIPFGEVRTYKEIASAIGNSNASRAVGHANNKNPIAIIIPCHRVIGTNGKLTGYAGGIDKKQKLLNLETT